MSATSEFEWSQVFGDALRHGSGLVHGLHRRPVKLPLQDWRQSADDSDRAVLEHCRGRTLDVGCGPGRMTEALSLGGGTALGIDLVPEAVEEARARGVAALVRDVFDHVPGERRWDCALLADGNIGIGGDPVRLLHRLHHLLAPAGRVVLDLAAPGVGYRTRMVSIQSDSRRSSRFPWSLVGPEVVPAAAAAAGFGAAVLHEFDGRWFAVLAKAGR